MMQADESNRLYLYLLQMELDLLQPLPQNHLKNHLVHAKFADGEYKDDKKLSPEYLLGYHCQRHELYKKKEEPESNSETQESKESN